MKITYLGTTVLLFDDGTDQLLLDAHLTRPSLFTFLLGRVRTDTALADDIIARYGIDRLRGIFLSHTHTDHAMDAPYIANATGADIYASPSGINIARGGSVPEARLHCFNGRAHYTVGSFEIDVLPSRHSKAHWYNNDLGKTIDQPLAQPARKREYKEGGSYDFLIRHSGRTYLIRPSYSAIPGQLDGIRADVLFLGIAGITKSTDTERAAFFAETIQKVRPSLVIPVHWDNFFTPLSAHRYTMPTVVEHTDAAMHLLVTYCASHGIDTVVQLPLSSLTL